MHPGNDKKIKSLDDPTVRNNVLAHVREGVRVLLPNLLPSTLKALDEQLQHERAPMYLFEDGSFEIVAPAIGSDMGPIFTYSDLEVHLVSERGIHDMNAGKVVWSYVP